MSGSRAAATGAPSVPVKIFGLQRTGTNLMAALLARNFRVRRLVRGTEWKHGHVRNPSHAWNGTPVRFILCVRNPYSWLLACYRYFTKAVGRDPTLPPQFAQDPPPSFESFVTLPSYEFDDPVERWNRMNRHWLKSLPPSRTAVVRLEDQVDDQIQVLERVQSHLALPRRSNGLRRIERRVDVVPGPRGPIDRADHLDRSYMRHFSPELLEHVNQRLDRAVMEELCYATEDRTLLDRICGKLELTVTSDTGDADIAEAAAGDTYDVDQVRRWSSRIDRIVEIGAHGGAFALLAAQCWPDCRVLAFERSSEPLRLLRINAQRAAPRVTPVQGAAGDIADAAGEKLDFDRALNHFGGEIDLLRLGQSVTALPLVQYAYGRGALNRVRWISGPVPEEETSRASLLDYLSDEHAVVTRSTPCGERFLARRVRPPRLRAESSAAPARPDRLTEDTAFDAATAFIRSIPDFPAARFRGRGIVICGGGRRYFPCAWVCINMLRHLGVTLPIELWGLNASEIDPQMRELVEPLRVTCVDASRIRRRHPARILDGWELKPYSIIHSRFREVLFLDADNVAVRDPTDLFDSKLYADHGAIFWPAYGPYQPDDPIWRICRLAYREESDFETGQILIDKSRCWKPLQLTMHMNENSDFYYQYTEGDKDTFHFAWRMLQQDYAMIPTPVIKVEGAAWQHGPDGKRLFQHRYEAKWSVDEANVNVPGFLLEDVCFQYLSALRRHEIGGGADAPRQRPGP